MALAIANAELKVLQPDAGMLEYLVEKFGGTVDELMEDQELMKFFKKDKKKKTSGLERVQKGVDENKCQCRVWKGAEKDFLEGSGYPTAKTGFAVQCNSKRADDSDFCKKCRLKEHWLGTVDGSVPKDEEHRCFRGDKRECHWVLNDKEGTITDPKDLPERKKKSAGRPKKTTDEKDIEIAKLKAQLKAQESEEEVEEEDEEVVENTIEQLYVIKFNGKPYYINEGGLMTVYGDDEIVGSYDKENNTVKLYTE